MCVCVCFLFGWGGLGQRVPVPSPAAQTMGGIFVSINSTKRRKPHFQALLRTREEQVGFRVSASFCVELLHFAVVELRLRMEPIHDCFYYLACISYSGIWNPSRQDGLTFVSPLLPVLLRGMATLSLMGCKGHPNRQNVCKHANIELPYASVVCSRT